MGQLTPVAFDIETSGIDQDAVITVAGFAFEAGVHLTLNIDARSQPDEQAIRAELNDYADGGLETEIVDSEWALLTTITTFVTERIDPDRHYLTAYNGETWQGGFDLPFCRTAFIRHDLSWPFRDVAYADIFELIDRFETFDNTDLAGVHDTLIGRDTCDPFPDSRRAVSAFESGEWTELLKHNLADIRRTYELARLAERFVPQSDFGMKNLDPPRG